mgnify:CR=1 FL=1
MSTSWLLDLGLRGGRGVVVEFDDGRVAARAADFDSADCAPILEELNAVFDPEALRDPGPGFERFLERRKKEGCF